MGEALTNYFTTTRTGVQIKKKFDDLEKKGDGSVMTARGDFIDKLGVTQPPMMQDTNALKTFVFVSPLDALMLRSFGLVILLLQLIILGVPLTNGQKASASQHFTKAREEEKTAVRDVTGIIMDAVNFAGRGGNTDKGDVCRRFLKDHRHALVPHNYQDAYNDLLKGLLVVHTVFASPRKINLDHYKCLYDRTENNDSLEYLISIMIVQVFE